MIPLFSRTNRILEPLTFTRTLYAFDFDGTLSKIVPLPGDAAMSRTTAKLLRELSKCAPVAIISGRSIEDLRRRLPFSPQYLVGNHGLEGLGESVNALQEAQRECSRWMKKLSAYKWVPGVEIEDKTYSLAIHYRRCRSKRSARVQIQGAIASLRGEPRLIAGKSVVNVLPSGAPHKGIALVRLMKKAEARNALYVGDDDTDEDVFTLPEGAVSVTVRVGRKKNSSARYFIDRQSEINRLLESLIRFHRLHVDIR